MNRRQRKPIGPCHYGIGTLFMQVEYPFLRYNLFFYVYVLSFYDCAKGDDRFLDALQTLESKLDESGRVVVERPHRALKRFWAISAGAASERRRLILLAVDDNTPHTLFSV